MHPDDLVASIAPDSLRVHAPTSILFLCGGKIPKVPQKTKKVITLRDAFLRVFNSGALPACKVILAEDAQRSIFEAGYSDLLEFESDIAQVVSLILLFVESPGSFAELGAFASFAEIAPHVLAIIEDKYYDDISFIRDGPIKHLEKQYADHCVLSLDRKEVGISDKGKLDKLDLKAFGDSIVLAVENRLEAINKFSKFNSENAGHIVMLISGLCQEYGALKLLEVKNYLKCFGVSEPRIENLLYCAELVGWINRTKKGNNTFFVAIPDESALDFNFKPEAKTKDKVRWRSDIREFWQKNDKPRWRAIRNGEED